MYQLDETIYFYAFTLLPILWLGYVWVSNWKKKTQATFASSKILDALSPNRSRFKPFKIGPFKPRLQLYDYWIG